MSLFGLNLTGSV